MESMWQRWHHISAVTAAQTQPRVCFNEAMTPRLGGPSTETWRETAGWWGLCQVPEQDNKSEDWPLSEQMLKTYKEGTSNSQLCLRKQLSSIFYSITSRLVQQSKPSVISVCVLPGLLPAGFGSTPQHPMTCFITGVWRVWSTRPAGGNAV